MANGGIIGPTNPVGKIISPKVSLFATTGTLTTGACTTTVDAVITAGGGGGGTGGGGAGGVRVVSCQAVSACTAYTITIGAGGSGAGYCTNSNGSNSVLGASPEPVNLIATGGGYGGRNGPAGNPGGSGGGGGMSNTRPPGCPALTNICGGCATACQGNDGGMGLSGAYGINLSSGGGGGAAAVGEAGNVDGTGYGGDGGTATPLASAYNTYGGAITPFTPTGSHPGLVAGGGGGFGALTPQPACVTKGAPGGGGAGTGLASDSPVCQTAIGNTGSGGGGTGQSPGACRSQKGGSGFIAVTEKGGATSVSGMWSMQDQYDESLAGNWSFASPFGDVNILVVGSGGGGSTNSGAGGGGGYQFNTALTLGTGVTYTATIGAGGTGGPVAPTGSGGTGNVSQFAGADIQTFASDGGGGGAASGGPLTPNGKGKPGASGGGGAYGAGTSAPRVNVGGCGNSPARFMSQGYLGGDGIAGDQYGGGGGGGAGAVGSNATGAPAGTCGSGGAGGAGSSAWPGDSTLRGGGGGGSAGVGGSAGGAGPGGGGAGGKYPGTQGCAGTANTGGGGGGAGSTPCGNAGGSGVVIIQYPGGPRASGGTVTPVPGCKTQHLFAATGCFVT